MGHSTVQMTLDRYGHLFPALHDQIAEGLDDVLTASVSFLRPVCGRGPSSGVRSLSHAC
jgi:hypothetical protein